MANSALKSGQVARRAGVSPQTLRYYERRGLLPRAARAANGYRMYPPSAVGLLQFIQRAQELGFALREIKEVLKVSRDPEADCGDVCRAVEKKIGEIDDRVLELRARRRDLKRLLDACPGKVPVDECPILSTMSPASRSGKRSPSRTSIGGDSR